MSTIKPLTVGGRSHIETLDAAEKMVAFIQTEAIGTIDGLTSLFAAISASASRPTMAKHVEQLAALGVKLSSELRRAISDESDLVAADVACCREAFAEGNLS